MILSLGAILGFISVAFGAYAEHGLRKHLTGEVFRTLMTALRYHQVHAIMIVILGIVLLQSNKLSVIPAFRWSAYAFLVGTALFSFSIYFSVMLRIPTLTRLAPWGGSTLMLGWLLLAWAGFIAIRKV